MCKQKKIRLIEISNSTLRYKYQTCYNFVTFYCICGKGEGFHFSLAHTTIDISYYRLDANVKLVSTNFIDPLT